MTLQEAIDNGDFCADCNDGIKNGYETRVNCGGPCPACALSCIMNAV
tara:strand:- start:980 stop:1120 length:141 start_codon:yes stop_codon:yes gene_type:complete